MIDLSFACNKPRALYEVLHWQYCHQCGAYVKIHSDCTQDYNITFYCKLAAKGWMKTITQIQTHTYSQQLQPVGRLYGKTLQQVMVGWAFTWTLTPVLMKLDGSPQLRLYNEKSDVIRSYYSLTHHSRSTSSTMSFAS